MTFITLGGRSIFLIKLRFIIFRLSWFKDNNTVRLSLEEHKLLEQCIKKNLDVRQTMVFTAVVIYCTLRFNRGYTQVFCFMYSLTIQHSIPINDDNNMQLMVRALVKHQSQDDNTLPQ